MKSECKPALARRRFLQTLSVGAAAGATAPFATQALADSESYDEKRKPRYKADSPDVQAYYRVNRYPSK